jgi:hypothetical protein
MHCVQVITPDRGYIALSVDEARRRSTPRQDAEQEVTHLLSQLHKLKEQIAELEEVSQVATANSAAALARECVQLRKSLAAALADTESSVQAAIAHTKEKCLKDAERRRSAEDSAVDTLIQGSVAQLTAHYESLLRLERQRVSTFEASLTQAQQSESKYV